MTGRMGERDPGACTRAMMDKDARGARRARAEQAQTFVGRFDGWVSLQDTLLHRHLYARREFLIVLGVALEDAFHLRLGKGIKGSIAREGSDDGV